MNPTDPFVPKSNKKLLPGQYWPIRLSNGKYALGIVLDVPSQKDQDTKGFFAGLLNWVGDEIPDASTLQKSKPQLLKQAKAHIKTIAVTNSEIRGHVDLAELNIEIPLQVDSRIYSPSSKLLQGYKIIRKATPKDHELHPVQSTWGYNFINILAEDLLKK